MKQTTLKYTISLFAVILVLLVITSDFHHDHQALTSVSKTCAVAVFQNAVAAGLVFFLLLLLLTDFSPKFTRIFYTTYIPFYVPRSIFSDRAPPK